jgi:hypothetical protein
MNSLTMRSRQTPRRLGLMVVLGLVVALVVAAVAALQPATADQFGYALAGPHGLPGHFSYQGIIYTNAGLCAGGSACAGAQASQWSRATFATNGEWPLRQVASLPTLFSADHAIYEPSNDPSMIGAGGPYVGDAHPFILFIQDPTSPDWYYLYQRPGGP